jgi:hypothetical protein
MRFLIETTSISEQHNMNAVDSRRVLVTIPVEVKDWLQERAKYHGGSLSAEVVRSARERMEREARDKAVA